MVAGMILDIKEAQRTKVVRLPGFLSLQEIEEVHRAGMGFDCAAVFTPFEPALSYINSLFANILFFRQLRPEGT